MARSAGKEGGAAAQRPLTAEEVAALVGGRAEAAAGVVVDGVQDLARAGPREAAFAASGKDVQGRDRGRRQEAALRATRAGLLLVAEGVDVGGRPCVRVADPVVAAAKVARHFHPGPRRYAAGVHPAAVVEEGASLGRGVSVGPFCAVRAGARLGDGTVLVAHVYVGEDCVVGPGCYFFPGVVLYPGVRLGRGVVVHANSVIGSDGFGYAWDGVRHQKIPQIGTVDIGDEVEIGAGCCIDRGTFGPTRVGRGTVVDNQVQIGHNCDVGEFVVLCGQVGLSGSTRVGDGAVMGGRAASAGHLTIGKGAKVGGWSAVGGDVPDGAEVAGAPAWDLRSELRARALWRRQVRRGEGPGRSGAD